MYSVVFTPSPPSHYGGVWVLPLISHNSKLTQYRGCGIGCPYDWRVFVETQKMTSVGLLVFNPLCMYSYKKRITQFLLSLELDRLPHPRQLTQSLCHLPFLSVTISFLVCGR